MSNSRKRILKNTLALYFRSIFILLISLYTIRIVLDVLGIEDYGTYYAVAGLVAMASFIPGSLASSAQRFYAFALGRKDTSQLNKIFSVNIILYLLISAMALILLETLGYWFVTNELVLPEERTSAVYLLYHYVVFAFIFSLFTAPFIAILIAHEDMHLFAYLSIFEALMKLAVVFALEYFAHDKLELYGLLLLIVSILTFIMYLTISFIRYSECQIKKLYWDTHLLKEIVGFTWWTFFGQLSTVFRTHAITVLLNQIFNPTVVAARAISVQVATNINMFSNNFNTGLYPPIVKAYASDDKTELLSLVHGGAKITFFLLWIVALPLLFGMHFILNLWLVEVPPYAVAFAQLALIESIILSLSLPVATLARATGKMMLYELVLGSIQIGIFIVSWIVLKMGYEPYSVFIVAIIANIIMFFVRLYIVKKLVEFDIFLFIKKVLYPVLIIVFISISITLLFFNIFQAEVINFIFTSTIAVLTSTIAMFYFGLDKVWRQKIQDKLRAKFKKDLSV